MQQPGAAWVSGPLLTRAASAKDCQMLTLFIVTELGGCGRHPHLLRGGCAPRGKASRAIWAARQHARLCGRCTRQAQHASGHAGQARCAHVPHWQAAGAGSVDMLRDVEKHADMDCRHAYIAHACAQGPAASEPSPDSTAPGTRSQIALHLEPAPCACRLPRCQRQRTS